MSVKFEKPDIFYATKVTMQCKLFEMYDRLLECLKERYMEEVSHSYVNYGNVMENSQVPEYVDYDDLYLNITDTNATITLSGHDVAFVEFGTGIANNGANSTVGLETVAMGSYGQGQGKQAKWRYTKKNWTAGTIAQKPFYNAIEVVMREDFPIIVKEVFQQ